MNVFILICFVISVIASGVTGDEGCVHGTSKKEFCNNCYCENGSWLCTEQACDFHHKRTERGVLVGPDLKNTPCAPNDYFKIDCNTCYCNIDKTGYLCTENLCSFTESPSSINNTLSQQNTTEINNQSHPLIATESINNPNNHTDGGGGTSKNDFSCTPGQTFKKDCNTCTCTPDGKNAVCTLKSCVGPAINITQ